MAGPLIALSTTGMPLAVGMRLVKGMHHVMVCGRTEAGVTVITTETYAHPLKKF